MSARNAVCDAGGDPLCAVDWLGLAQCPDETVQTILLTASLLLASWSLREDVDPRSPR